MRWPGGRRFVSERRIPAVIVAVVALATSGVLLYDIAAVRMDRPAAQWRRRAADELATRPLDSTWVVGGAVVAVVAGLWLVWLALTPGLRGVLPVRTAVPDLRAGLGRRAAAGLLRDSVQQVSGVADARVKVGRRKVKAWARVHFRDPAQVRQEVLDVLEEGMGRLSLASPLALELRIREDRGLVNEPER